MHGPEFRQRARDWTRRRWSRSSETGVTFFDTAEAYGPYLKRWIVPIPGTTKRQRLDENLDTVDVQLSVDDLAEIAAALSRLAVHGARYPDHLQKLVGR